MNMQQVARKNVVPILNKITEAEPILKPFMDSMKEKILCGVKNEPLDYEAVVRKVLVAHIACQIDTKARSVHSELIHDHLRHEQDLTNEDLQEYQQIADAFKRVQQHMEWFIL